MRRWHVSTRWRAAALAGLVALAGAPSLATAAPPARPCRLVEDGIGDTSVLSSVPVEHRESAVDVVSADLASDHYMLTGVIRLDRLTYTFPMYFLGRSYDLEFSVAGSNDRFYLSMSQEILGVTFDAGYRTDGTTPLSTPVKHSLGRPRGVVDLGKHEIRVHAPLSLFASRVSLGRGRVLVGVRVVVRRWVGWGDAVPREPQESLVADEATTTKTYAAGAPTCVQVGDYCAPPSGKFVGGTARGENGNDVNIQISVAAVTAAGQVVDMNGCPVNGYVATVRLNPYIADGGSKHTSQTTNTWRVNQLPENTAYLWIETYPRGANGAVTVSHYGRSMRRRIPVNRNDVRITQPSVCGKGGRTGTISGTVVDRQGKPVAADRIVTWSEAPDSATQILGWGMGGMVSGNRYRIDALASGQKYSVWASLGKKTTKYYHVQVNACRDTQLRLVVG